MLSTLHPFKEIDSRIFYLVKAPCKARLPGENLDAFVAWKYFQNFVFRSSQMKGHNTLNTAVTKSVQPIFSTRFSSDLCFQVNDQIQNTQKCALQKFGNAHFSENGNTHYLKLETRITEISKKGFAHSNNSIVGNEHYKKMRKRNCALQKNYYSYLT